MKLLLKLLADELLEMLDLPRYNVKRQFGNKTKNKKNHLIG